MTISRIDGTQPRISTEPMAGRVTALPAERAFRAALADGASVLLGGVESAARSLPGGEVLAAAVHGSVRAAASSSGRTPISAQVGPEAGLVGLADGLDQLELIALQQRIQEENRRFSTLSNVLKARHETAKTAIGNIR
ncbi:MAG: hypothetical protein OHK0013_32890 [Sandaracinaceae bacterium]